MMMKNPRVYLPGRFVLFAAFVPVLLAAPSLAQGHADWSYNLGIYEVNVRQYTPEGTFTAFEAHLDRLQEMGAGILWFMPIHPIGRLNRLGSLGSYYSVRDYLDVNPEFGTLDDFQTLVQKIHDRGMYVIIDWVANHTAWDNRLTTEHPEWYSKDAEGRFTAPPGTNWTDVIELDYSQQGLRDYMINAMRFWIRETGIDGFRCDAVDKVPKEFWVQAIAELKTVKPGLFMLAEGDGREWHDAGFDMTYSWGLYGFGSGVLKRIADGTDTAADLNAYATGEKTSYPPQAYRMYFTSNHDENSWQGTPAELFGAAADAFAVLTATFNGMPLVYGGQEAGLDKRLLFFDKDRILWRDHVNADLYARLLRLKKTNRALWNGESGALLQHVPTTDNTDVFAFVREKEGDKVLAVLNLSDRERSVTFKGTTFIGSFRNVFTDESATLTAESALTLPAWGYLLYEKKAAETGVEADAAFEGFALGRNFPNPFNSATRIFCTLPARTDARLTVSDLLGREVQDRKVNAGDAGTCEVTLSAADLPSGVYMYRLQAGDRIQTRRMLLIR
jgi:cyclomaltodextrinase / maltogenic alpha-amylase / neopullulanase